MLYFTKRIREMVIVIKVQCLIRRAYLYHLWLLNITVMKPLNRLLISQMLPMMYRYLQEERIHINK